MLLMADFTGGLQLAMQKYKKTKYNVLQVQLGS